MEVERKIDDGKGFNAVDERIILIGCCKNQFILPRACTGAANIISTEQRAPFFVLDPDAAAE